MLLISTSIEMFLDVSWIRVLSSMDCKIFFHTVRRTMALKGMKYCFRSLASDLASLVKLHFARMVSRASMIYGKWFATGLTAAMHALHLVSDKRWRVQPVLLLRIAHHSGLALKSLYKQFKKPKNVDTSGHDSAACTTTFILNPWA